MSDQPKKGSPLLAVVIVLLLAAAAGFYYFTTQATTSDATVVAKGEAPTVGDSPVGVVPTKTFNLPGSKGTAGVAMTQTVDISKAGQLTYPLYGSPDAKIKVIEYTSLTCSHCADYSLNTLPEVKKQLVDTNVISYEKRDFPLNAPALDAAMILHCLDDDKADGARELLYRNQSTWSYEANYRDYLKKTAALAGMDGDASEACFNDAELKAKIVADVQNAGNTFEVRSTPTFVLETIGSEAKPVVIVGQYPTQEFIKILQSEVTKVGGAAPVETAPAPAPEAATDVQVEAAPAPESAPAPEAAPEPEAAPAPEAAAKEAPKAE